MKPEALLFDLDDTLLHSEALYRDVMAELRFDEQAYARARESVKARLPGKHVAARNRLLYLKALQEARGDFSPAAALRAMAEYEACLERAVPRFCRAGTREILVSLARRYRIGVVTNENLRTQLLKLRALDPAGDWLQALVCSEEWGAEKPDAGLFVALAERLRVPHDRCVMIGDSWEVDLEPAEKLGMTPVLSLEYRQDSDAPAHVSRIQSLAELPEWLERMGHARG